MRRVLLGDSRLVYDLFDFLFLYILVISPPFLVQRAANYRTIDKVDFVLCAVNGIACLGV
ncbi:hypothetical protein N799_13420 [Lysobacter arseniciresistens ZS79]|uniref:Uncharacterized protein n=1 Tax=Lysobacter arseniciresistens ZS79 TaxID=913325 RepID=A0A0A0EQ77_9GAMM|nr:hypothetical protein N799_13420 [Lysobacter arseniciresistens ZS79]